MIYKNKDIETNINNKTVDIGNVGVRFYTEDENTGSIRIYIKWNGQPVNLDTVNMRPKLDLFLSDGSIFIDETINIISPKSGLIQYNIPNKVIKHAGIVNAKLFLESESESVHVANFSFNIVDSCVENKVQKEISLNLVEDTVRRIMSDDLTVLLDGGFKTELTTDLQNYISENSEQFKGPQGERGLQGEQGIQGERGEKGDTGAQGPKGDTGEQGPAGQDGKDGKNGINGIDGINGNPGPQGPPGKDGRDGVNGKDGEKGEPFKYTDFTTEQLNNLKGPKGDPFKYTDFTQAQLDALKGPKGDNGVAITDTGWLDIVLQNGVVSYSSATTPKYRIIKIGTSSYVYVKGTVENFTASVTTIGGVPKEYADSASPVILNEVTGTGSVSFKGINISAYTGNLTVIFGNVPPTSASIKFYAHWVV